MNEKKNLIDNFLDKYDEYSAKKKLWRESFMYEKLVSYAAKQLELDASEITPDSTFESLGIDSLDIVEMIMDLESELGVELEMEDQKIATFQELADFIESKLN